MTINFQCKGCHELFAVPDAMAGKRVRCNICEVEQVVPQEGAIVDFRVAGESRPAQTGTSRAAALTPISSGGAALTPIGSSGAALTPIGSSGAALTPIGSGGASLAPIGSGAVAGPLAGPYATPQLAGLSLAAWIWMVGGLVMLALCMMIATAMYARARGPVRDERLVTANRPATNETGVPSHADRRRDGVGGGGSFELAQPSGNALPDPPPVVPRAAPPAGQGAAPPDGGDAAGAADPPPDDAGGAGNAGNGAGADAEPERMPLVPWTAGTDPCARKVEPKKGKLTIPVQSFQGAYFPASASNFVLLAGRVGISDVYQVFDLRSGGAIGQAIHEELDDHGVPAFSPDGRYVAARLRPDGGTKVGVWSFVDGDSKWELDVSDNSMTPWLHFAGDHRLLTAERVDFYSLALKLWDLETGQRIDEMTVKGDRENAFLDESLAVSQNGRFMAFVVGRVLNVADLIEGGCVGQAELPEPPSKCIGMAFSPDGQRLAGVFSIASGDQLVCWDCSTGKVVVDRRYHQSMPHVFYDGHALEWTPDSTGLVYRGHILLEGSSGEAVWNFPKTTNAARRMIHPDRMLVVMRDARANEALDSAKLPDDQIAEAITAVRAGGNAVDAALPPLSTPDLFGAKTVNLPNGFVNWSASVDAAPAARSKTSRDILIAEEGNKVHQVMFAGAETGKVIVRKEIGSKLLAGRSVPAQFNIEVYDVSTGKQGNQLDVPSPYRLIDVSPSGSRSLVGLLNANNEFERLDVLSMAPKEHVAGWRPYSGEPDDQKPVRSAVMISDTLVLTSNPAGKLIAWQVPECKALYSIDGFGQVLARSGTRRFVIGQQQGTLRIFESTTGECRGDLMRPNAGTAVLRSAYHEGGERLAAAVGGAGDKSMVIWNLKTGEILSEFPLSNQMFAENASPESHPESLVWRGDGHLFLDHHYLIDVDGKAVVWQYELPDGLWAGWCTGEQQWYVTAQASAAPAGKSYYLTYVDLPSSNVRRKTELLKLENQLVLSPGTRVRLNLELGQGGGARVEQAVRKSLTDRLEANQVIVDPGAPTALVVSTRERETGARIGMSGPGGPGGPGGRFGPFGPFGRGGGATNPVQSFAQKRLECVLALVDPSGVTRWSWTDGVTMRPFGAAQQSLQEEMQTRFAEFLTQGEFVRVALPRYVFGELNEIVGGTSYLTIQGEGATPPR